MNIIQVFRILTMSLVTLLVSVSNSYAVELNHELGLPLRTLDRIEKILNQPLSESINCWGVALWSLGFIQEVRPAIQSELLNVFKEHKCRKLGPDETPIAGDFGSFFNLESGIFHTFVHLKNSWVLEKESPDPTHIPSIIDFNKKFEGYPKPFDLKTGCKDASEVGCNLGVVNYRCNLEISKPTPKSPLSQKYDKLMAQINLCKPSNNFCGDEFSNNFSELISLLNSALSEPSKLSSEFYKATGEIILFVFENSYAMRKLSLPAINSFGEFEYSLSKLENFTYKNLNDFPDFSKN